MKRLRILLILILLRTFVCDAQLFSFEPEVLFEQFPVFNSSYIQQQRIRRIIFDIIDKKDWQEAEDKDITEVYEFNTDGKLKRKYFTSIKKIIQYETHNKKHKTVITKELYEYDTTATEYHYQNNLLIERNIYPNNYTEATYYKYCGNWVCKEEKYIETFKTISTGNKILDKLFLKAYDSIAVFDYGNQIKHVFYNNEKLPYKEKFIYFNENKKIVEITEQLMVANGKIRKQFLYNSSGLLEKSIMNIDYGYPETYSIDFLYDDKNQVTAEKHFKNNHELKEYQYIYSENNWLKSILIRNFDNKDIRIIKLKFEYQ